MITWQEWIEGASDFPRAWQDFLISDAGRAGLEVLATRMVTEHNGYPPGQNIIEARAITGAEDDGYRKCFNYLTQLSLHVVESIKKQRQERVKTTEGFADSNLPAREDLRKKIIEDPIIAEHERRQARLGTPTMTPVLSPSSFSKT